MTDIEIAQQLPDAAHHGDRRSWPGLTEQYLELLWQL